MSRLRSCRVSPTTARLMMVERANAFDLAAETIESKIEEGWFDTATGPTAARTIAAVLRRSADADWQARPSRLRGGPRCA
ncbi:hypothetical protein [Sorangium sp. So ce233]|uniref:hypothetical protein n=1 Tax=Sorangium sp. So ce233 TaxID=3133290 RepID=UPI003F641E16